MLVIRVFGLASILYSLSSIGISRKEDQNKICKHEQVNIAINGQMRNLDPINATTYLESMIAEIARGQLVKQSNLESVVPDIARTWDVSSDQKVFTFKLHNDRFFSNGDLITAYDIKRSLEHAIKTSSFVRDYVVKSEIFGLKDFVSGRSNELKGIRVLKSDELQIELLKPSKSFIYTLSTSNLTIVNPNDSNISSGAYIVTMNKKDELILTKNRRFNDQKKYYDKIIVHAKPEERICDLLKKTGYDFVLGGLFLNKCKSEKYKPYQVPSANIAFIAFGNQINSTAATEMIRCTNKENLYQFMNTEGYHYSIANHPFPGAFDNLKPSRTDCRKSRPKKVEVITHREHLVPLIEKLSNDEIKYTARLVKGEQYLNHLRSGNYEAIFIHFAAGFNNFIFFANLFHSKQGFWKSNYSNSEYDHLVSNLDQTMDLDQESKVLQKIIQLLYKYPPALFLFNVPFISWIANEHEIGQGMFVQFFRGLKPCK